MRRKTGGRLFFFGVVAGSAMLFGSMLFGYGAQAGEDIRDLVLKGIWDNARFIGNLGFRQNEQTFDALRVGTTYLPDTDIGYIYLEEAVTLPTDSAPRSSCATTSNAFWTPFAFEAGVQ